MTAPPLSCRLIGSGPVGLAFCLFALRAGIDRERIAIDRNRIAALAGEASTSPSSSMAPPSTTAAPSSTRVPARPPIRRQLAISEGSRQLLDRIIAFPEAARIERIDVELAGRSGRTRIEAADFAVPALGHVLTHEVLTRALARAVRDAFDGLPAAAPDAPVDLVVHAEGAIDSDRAARLEFGQSALLAEVRAGRRSAGSPSTAYERFDRDGPLALLPIGSAGDRFAMVWCDRDPINAERRQWPREQLDAALNERFGDQLGPLTIEGPVDLAPLTRTRRLHDATTGAAGSPRQVWIGNASQMLHPVAGQGLNLGLRDAFELARLLGDADEAAFLAGQTGRLGPGNPVGAGDPVGTVGQVGTAARAGAGCRAGTANMTRARDDLDRALARFDRQRDRDRGLLVGVTDQLARGFRVGGFHGLQSTLLTALDLLPALRRPLADTLLYGRRQSA